MADYISQFTGSEIDQRLAKVSQLETSKQDKLVSGSNIKTINGEPILGPGDITIQGGDPNAVKYTAQTLTDAQKAQARANIDAASLADIADMDFVTATTLPTASASTMGHIYLIGPDANDNYDRYFTQESGGTYSWVPLGSTQIDLSTYATQEEVSQLETNQRKIFPYEAKQLLVGLLKKIAYLSSDAESDVEDLEDILLNEIGLVSLQATFTQGSAEFYPGQSLDLLVPYLEVVGLYDDLEEREITNYILSGELVAGTSTITVSYGGKTTTFTVSVTDAVYYREGSKMIRPYFLNSANQNYGPATVDGVTLVYTRSKNSSNVLQPSRACYPYFDLLLTSGKDYKWTVKATGLPTGCNISADIQYFNQSFKNAGDANLLANHSADMLASGWLTTTINDGVITVTYGSETASSSLTLIGARLNLRLLDSSDQDISWPSDCVIEKLVIQEVE